MTHPYPEVIAPAAAPLPLRTPGGDIPVALGTASAWFRAHPGARRPTFPVVNIRVEGDTRDEKVSDLKAIAASWGTEMVTLGEGTLYAEIVFGPVTFEAHVAPQDRTLGEYKDRMRRAREAQGGSGAAA